mgnify:FL=1
MANNDDGLGARLNHIRDLVQQRIVAQGQKMAEAAGPEPVGAYGRLPLADRKRLLGQMEESQGWDAVLDTEAQAQGIPPGYVPRSVIDFAKETWREIEREANESA